MLRSRPYISSPGCPGCRGCCGCTSHGIPSARCIRCLVDVVDASLGIFRCVHRIRHHVTSTSSVVSCRHRCYEQPVKMPSTDKGTDETRVDSWERRGWNTRSTPASKETRRSHVIQPITMDHGSSALQRDDQRSKGQSGWIMDHSHDPPMSNDPRALDKQSRVQWEWIMDHDHCG